MTTTQQQQNYNNMFHVPQVSISPSHHPEVMTNTPNSLDHMMTNFPGRTRTRSRCISCSDSSLGNSFEESTSFLLESTLMSRRARTSSVCERIQEGSCTGTVTYFCKSKGHGFIRPDNQDKMDSGDEHFVHVSDIDSQWVPLKGDQVSYRLCPIPPKFEKFQAVNVNISHMVDLPHKRWDNPETPDEIQLEESASHPPPADV